MGGGTWNSQNYAVYTATTKGTSLNFDGSWTATSTQDAFKARRISDRLNPYNVIRECCDSDEHPDTIPVILALDVTGSMGSGATKVAEQLNPIMTSLYEQLTDVQFMVMGIGDLNYDNAPLQTSQFESDIRIAEQLDEIYFEGGGGGNGFESYTAAWYFGVRHTKLDCWKRGKKGIIITLGDEPLNPYLPAREVKHFIGDNVEADIETKALYKEAIEKFDIFHISVDDRSTSYSSYKDRDEATWKAVLKENYLVSNLDSLKSTIVDIIINCSNNSINNITQNNDNSDGISW